MDFLRWLEAHGGLCTIEAAFEHTSKAALDPLRGSQVWAPLRGWVALVGMRDARTRALQLGGVLSCLSALALLDIWVPTKERMHVRIVRKTHSARTKATATDDDVVTHRLRLRHLQERPARGVDDVLIALRVAAVCVCSLDLVTIVGDAVVKQRVTLEQVRDLAAELPQRIRPGLLAISGLSQSCTEVRVAELLRRARIRFEQQAQLLPDVRVDFAIGRVVVECDSRLWHGGNEYYERDRARDAKLVAAGYIPVRLSYHQVMDGDPLAVIRAAIAAARQRPE